MVDEPGPVADVNPYAVTPAIRPDEILSGGSGPQRPAYKLYSPWSVVLATFFGSTLAGGILLALEVHLCDQYLNVKKTFAIPSAP